MPKLIGMPDGSMVEFPDDMSDAQISSVLRAQPASAPEPKKKSSLGSDLIRAGAEGATMGWSQELFSGIDSMLGKGKYEDLLKEKEAQDAEIGTGTRMLGNIGGGIASTLATGGLAGAFGLGRLGAGIPQALKYMGLGAAEGAITGAGTNPEDRVKGAAVGGLTGGAVGVAAPYAVRGLTGMVNRTRHAQTPAANAAADLTRALRDDGDTAATITQRLGQASLTRPGMATLADVGGENVQGVVERVAQTPGAGRAGMVPRLTNKQSQQAIRLSSDLREMTGTSTSAYQTVQELIGERAAAARPLYEQAHQFDAGANPGIMQIWGDETQRGYGQAILNSPDLRRTLQTEFGVDDVEGAPLMTVIDAWQRSARDMIDNATRNGNNNLARVLTGMRQRVLRVVDQENPAFAEARAAFAGPSQFMDAMGHGQAILRTPADEFAGIFTNAAPVDQQAMRIGAVSAIIEKMGGKVQELGDMTRILRSPEMQQKIMQIVPPHRRQHWARRLQYEANSSRLTGRALTGSPTARRLAERAEVEGMVGDLMIDAMTGAGTNMIMRVLRAGPKWVRNAIRSRRDELLADLLTNPAQSGNIGQLLQQAEMPMTPATANPFGAGAATAGGVQAFAPWGE
jgi:hypothetical protein